MIAGKVNSEVDKDGYVYLKPQITLSLAGVDRVFRMSQVTVDTGFTGWLAMPGENIEELGLTSYGQRPANQAGGVGIFSIYGALVLWHGDYRPVLVHRITGDPLIGMALLEDSRLTVDAREDGDVIIEEQPRL